MNYIDIIGWCAAALTLGTYSMKTMLPLRVFAIFANILFAAYGWLTEIYPTLFLHLVLLPFNSWRLYQILSTLRKVRHARDHAPDLSWLKDLVKPTHFAPGTPLFAKGDRADFFYYLDSGSVHFDEIDVTITGPDVFGEIAFFSRTRERTQSATTTSDCQLYRIDEATLMRLYYQNPSFGFFVVELLVERLLENAQAAQKSMPPHAVSP